MVCFCARQIQTIKSILHSELISGLRVNFFKTKISGIRVDQYTVDRFSVLLNCCQMFIPFIYLNFPIGGNHRKTQFWNVVLHDI